MGTESAQGQSETPDQVDPEIAAIQQSLTDDETDPVQESAVLEAASPEALTEDPATVPPPIPATAHPSPATEIAPPADDSPAIAGFEAAGPPMKAILTPFVIYDLAWIAYASVLVWQLLGLPAATPAYEWEYYEYALWAGIALTALGPLLILAVWLITRLRHRESNGIGLSTLLVGSAATLLGVAVWWGALIAVDYVRLGSVF